jgi:hypothetical protein
VRIFVIHSERRLPHGQHARLQLLALVLTPELEAEAGLKGGKRQRVRVSVCQCALMQLFTLTPKLQSGRGGPGGTVERAV